jgi:hypothetical protein
MLTLVVSSPVRGLASAVAEESAPKVPFWLYWTVTSVSRPPGLIFASAVTLVAVVSLAGSVTTCGAIVVFGCHRIC